MFVVKLIEYESWEYQQACKLRYRLFYADRNLSRLDVFSSEEKNYYHLAIAIEDLIVAYGQLVSQTNSIYLIKQMVVEPNYQKQNLGTQIVLKAIALAQEQGATKIVLNSRLSAVGFYQKLGFYTCGVKFPSPTTGIFHISMKKNI